LANTEKDYTADDTAVVFSSQKSQFADYTTWKGIENKTGIEQKYAATFLIKELLDDALDYLETSTTQHHSNNTTTTTATDIQPEIHVVIEKNQGKYIRIVVSKSNYHDNYSKAVFFSSHRLKSVFDYDRYHSSKRNQFKITKGALGNALKEVLCIPYVLACDGGII
jgi:hypothetical protein